MKLQILLTNISLLQMVLGLSYANDFNTDQLLLLDSLAEPIDTDFLRERRDTEHYIVLESPGLRSHFHIDRIPTSSSVKKSYLFNKELNNDDNDYSSLQKNLRQKREIIIDNHEPIEPDDSSKFKSEIENDFDEQLPLAEKQFAKPQELSKRSWGAYTSDYDLKSQTGEDNLAPEASVNEGIKTRAPRVNFVTQQKKSNIEAAEAREQPTIAKPIDYYLSGSVYDNRPIGVDKYYYNYRQSKYEMYPRKYQRYDRGLNDPYYNPYYADDSYIPRTPTSFYNYPSGQYDLPEPRDYPTYTNEIDRMMPPPPIYPSSYQIPFNKRRIIYYATLPEVIRTPPNVDLRYRSTQYNYNDRYNRDPTTRYDTNYYYQPPYDSYRSNRLPRYYNQNQQPQYMVNSKPSTTTQSYSLLDKTNKSSNLDTVRLSNGIKVKDQPQQQPQQQRGAPQIMEHRVYNDNNLSNNNNRKNNQNIGSLHPSFQDGVDQTDQTYFSRSH